MADFISVVQDTRQLERLASPGVIDAATKTAIGTAVDVLLSHARAEAPKRTGRSAQGIRGFLDRGQGQWVGRIVPLGQAYPLRILATGAQPHEITRFRYQSVRRTKGAYGEFLTPGGTVRTRAHGSLRALRFKAGGNELFRARVFHPGVRPNPFMDRAASRGTPAALAAMDAVFKAAIDDAR